MTALPDPTWPVIVLAVITLFDAVICIKPVSFIAQCWNDVHFDKKWWRLAAALKFAATAGLLAGLVIPWLSLVTAACLVLYFLIAIGFHIRARDFGRNLFVNATGMLALCVAVLVWSFLV